MGGAVPNRPFCAESRLNWFRAGQNVANYAIYALQLSNRELQNLGAMPAHPAF